MIPPFNVMLVAPVFDWSCPLLPLEDIYVQLIRALVGKGAFEGALYPQRWLELDRFTPAIPLTLYLDDRPEELLFRPFRRSLLLSVASKATPPSRIFLNSYNFHPGMVPRLTTGHSSPYSSFLSLTSVVFEFTNTFPPFTLADP